MRHSRYNGYHEKIFDTVIQVLIPDKTIYISYNKGVNSPSND